jgi:mannose-6-phosphate isomerase-like protein (cupin superfamily)
MASNFTHKNFKDDIPDFAADRPEDVEARFGRSALDAEQVGISYFRYGPDSTPPYGHHHEVQEEAYVIVSGSGRMKIDDEVIELRQWDVIRVAPDAVRGFRAGPKGLELIAVGGDRPPDGDGNLVRDWWTED